MGKNGLLLFDFYPVELIDVLGFGVVVGFYLFCEEREEKGLEGEVAVEEAELLEDDFAALEAPGAFVLIEFFFHVAFDGGAAYDLALDGALDGQAGLLRGEFEEFIDERE